jgi:hypothetical protein
LAIVTVTFHCHVSRAVRGTTRVAAAKSSDVVGVAIGGEPARGRAWRRNLVFGGSLGDPDHDAVVRIGGKAPGDGTILQQRH